MRWSSLAFFIALASAGCLIDRSAIGAAGSERDAYVLGVPDAAIERVDAPGLDVGPSGPDAHDEDPDAHVVVGTDAWAPDAYVPPPDAYVVPDAFEPVDAITCGAESCNARDDDCDDVIDEAACFVTTTTGDRVACTPFARAGRTYLYCVPTASWSLARTICRGFGDDVYDLVALGNGAEQDAVAAVVERDVWLGLTDDRARVPEASDGDYRWVDGRSPSFTAWDTGEPTTSLTDGCVVLTTDGFWDALSCELDENVESFVCEAAAR